MPLKLVVCDAYDAAGRAALAGAGCTAAGELYARLLRRVRPDAHVSVLFPADAGSPLDLLANADGIVWTGSSLSVHVDGDARVERMLGICRDAFSAGVPQFGSCFAAQLAVTAAGGRCAPSPKGREFGVSRDIALNAAGAAHPLFAGKAARFDALTSHEDEIVELPDGVTVLADNDWCAVQAVDVRVGDGVFWAVQYHPEYDLREIARLCALRQDQLIAQGQFADEADAAAWSARLEAAYDAGEAPAGADPQLADPGRPTLELLNWLERHSAL